MKNCIFLKLSLFLLIALKEADYLRKNIEDFKVHANYDNRLDSIDNIYYSEMFAKLLKKENPSTVNNKIVLKLSV